jgi:predicted AAA+ superfamily ATPase
MDEIRMGLPRTLCSHIRSASALFPVLLVTGARQVGKTTLLRELCAYSTPFGHPFHGDSAT